MGKEAKDVVGQFKGEMYLLWRKDVLMFLTQHGLEHYMEPPTLMVPPTPPTQEAAVNVSTTKGKEKEKEVEETGSSSKKKKEKWTQKQVLSQLYFCVSQQYRVTVLAASTVHALFTEFDNTFLAVDRLRAITLKQKARSFEMDISKPMIDQFMRYETMLNDLRAIGAEFTPEEMRENTLIIIPKQHLKTILDTYTFNPTGLNALTYEQIKHMCITRSEQGEAYNEKKTYKKRGEEEDFSLFAGREGNY